MEEMTWEQILNRAIAKEQEASSNYQALAKRVSHPGSQQMLAELAEEEKRHKEILEGWRGGKVKGCPLASLPDLGVAGQQRDVKFDQDLTPEEAVRLAIREEEMAFAFYEQLAKGLEQAESRALSERLAAEERRHKFRLERMLEEEILQEM